MRFNKEFLYHFSCEKCESWWSYPSTNSLDKFTTSKNWFCPHCGHKHKPPHTDQNVTTLATEEQLQKLRELI